ncbi:MAG: Gfo/Idh/MocA family oxidoreductase, partial [Chloroflexi bacterium]|nr:Gfo/Idh/MocA family oxidoreductase [Chloroflexota bacterium]
MNEVDRSMGDPKPAEPLRIAVAGAGTRAQVHLAAIAATPAYWQLAGMCDVRPERAEAAGRQYAAPSFGDPVTMLEETRPDALYVVVPPDGHHPLTLAAAERGVHVITEVPISITLPLADLMIDACRRHGVVLEVAESIQRSPR